MSEEPATGEPVSTIGRSLDRARDVLEAASASPRLDAEVLLAHVLGWGRARIHARSGDRLEPAAAMRFDALVERRQRGEPVAYLTGRREFWSLDLVVTPDTLIPRPETEHLVEVVLGAVPHDAGATIADVGTGSGAVALAVASERPRSIVLGTDRSRAAVAVARENADRLGCGNASFIVADACAPLAAGRWSVVVSNPPYVADGDPHLATGDVRFEPFDALVSGPRGLDMLEVLARQGPSRLVPGGWLVLEHGGEQGAGVRALLSEAGLESIETVRDLAGNERVTAGRRTRAGDAHRTAREQPAASADVPGARSATDSALARK